MIHKSIVVWNDAEKYRRIIDQVNLSDLKNKSVFITGGTGFFGLWQLKLLKLLNESGWQMGVTLLSREPESFLQNNQEYRNLSWLSWVKGDVVNYEFPTHNFDLIIHGAANTSPAGFEKPVKAFHDIVQGTKHVLDHAVYCRVSRVLIISSGAVYGSVSNEVSFISESIDTAPQTNLTENAYGEAKRASEMLAFCYAKENGFSVVIARCFAFTGRGIGKHLILSVLIEQALIDQEMVINGTGMARRSFLHGADLAVWLLKFLTEVPAGIYNVGSDVSYTVKELAELIKEIIAPQKNIKILGAHLTEQRLNYVPNIDKAKNLGLHVWTSLEESIKELNK